MSDELKTDSNDLKEQKADQVSEKDLLSQLEQDKQDLENRYKRALADYQNLLKSSAAEKSEIFKYSLASFLVELLPIYDNLKKVIHSLKPDEQNNPWVEGIKHVTKQFQEVLSSNGVEEIKSLGEKFDYHRMEAIEGQGEIVVQEIQTGYLLNDKVIIAAKVIVGDDEDNNKNKV